MKGSVFSACDYTGNMVRDWAMDGYECFCVDIQHDRREDEHAGAGVIHYVEADLFDYLPPRRQFDIAFFFPECTNLAGSGARWFKSKGLRGVAKGISLFERCIEIAEWMECPWMLENPVGVLSTYWRKPDYIFQPWMYGELESKATCLWTGGGFVMPQPICTSQPHNVKQSVWMMGPSDDRGRKRSVTPPEFAKSVFLANRRER